MLRALHYIRLLTFISLVLGGATASAESNGPRPWKWLFQIQGDFHYSQSDADYIDGGNYSQQFATGVVMNSALGVVISKSIYFGLRYEYWYAQRKMSGAGGAESNRLDYHGIAAELGYKWGNQRLFWLATGSVFYPLKLAVQSSLAPAYTSTNPPLAFQGRVTIGLRLNSLFTILLSGGYRYASLGDLRNAGGSFLSGSATFNLSGPFAGLGFGITF